MLKSIAKHEILDNVGGFLIMVLPSTDEEAPGNVAVVWPNLQNDVELCVMFTIFAEFVSWFSGLRF